MFTKRDVRIDMTPNSIRLSGLTLGLLTFHSKVFDWNFAETRSARP